MAKYGKPDTGRPKGFFPRIDMITVYARDRAPDRQGNGLACALRAVAGERQNQNAERAAVRAVRTVESPKAFTGAISWQLWLCPESMCFPEGT